MADSAVQPEPALQAAQNSEAHDAAGELFDGLHPDEKVMRAALRHDVLAHLELQGFKVTAAGIIGSVETDKERLRDLHAEAVDALRARGARALARREGQFIERLALGRNVAPSKVEPKLVPIDDRNSLDGQLWRWTSLHWSVPVSSGYGRRLRFLVLDAAHDDALMGLIGLGDPVFALRSRDDAIGWTQRQRKDRLACLMDAFVLGAIPPYANILGGKLIAMLAGCAEVQQAFAERYGHRRTLIAERDPNAKLAAVTTSSALGRSSIYNRVRRRDGSLALEPVGYTGGSGDFHFSGAIYSKLAAFAAALDPAKGTHRHERWGNPGFRNRREVLHLSLDALGFDARALRVHGVRREVFVNRLAPNAFDYLRGETDELSQRPDSSASDIAAWWRDRWAVPRSLNDLSWLQFDPDTWRMYD